MAEVILRNVKKVFGAVSIIPDVNMEIADGEFIVLVGPSGCGKSTLLRMIAGLESISGGQISIDGRLVNDLEPRERDIAMVFQSYALYPHMSVAKNLGFSLAMKKASPEQSQKTVETTARSLALEPYLDRLPRALSGGQRQRVAMGRAIVRHPKVFLFDEPLSNLDAQLRVKMRTEVRRLHQQLGVTSIYVTHDQVEAMTMADRIVVLDRGRIVQIGSPLDLYERPATRFVAEFIGSPSINILGGEVLQSGLLNFGKSSFNLALTEQTRAGAVDVGIRPEDFAVTESGGLAAKVNVVEHLGAETYVFLDAAGSNVCWRVPGTAKVAVGDTISLAVDPKRIHLFEPGTGLRIS